MNSGSSANLLLLSALKEHYGWGHKAEVIVPCVTWATTVTPVQQLGLQPVFVDISLDNYGLCPEEVNNAITANTKAIFVAHLLGFPAYIDQLVSIAKEHGLVIIEDCCESQGASKAGTKVGNFGIGGTFSFYWGHHMTTIEGGMICTNNYDLYKLLLLKRSHGLARELPEIEHQALKEKHCDIDFRFLFLTDDFNLRSTEINAAIGINQLQSIDSYIEIRNENYSLFTQKCKFFEEHLRICEVEGMSSFVLPFLFRDKPLKERFAAFLNRSGIETRPIISGNLLRQPFLRSYLETDGLKMTNSDLVHFNGIYIGNNQFVDTGRLEILFNIMDHFFKADYYH